MSHYNNEVVLCDFEHLVCVFKFSYKGSETQRVFPFIWAALWKDWLHVFNQWNNVQFLFVK